MFTVHCMCIFSFFSEFAVMSYKTLAGQLVNLQKENPLARAVNPTKTVWDVGLRLNCGRIVCLRTCVACLASALAAAFLAVFSPHTHISDFIFFA